MLRCLKNIITGTWKTTLLVALIALVPLCVSAKIEADLGANEVKLGKAAADQLAKESKLSTNEADLARVRAIGNKIADVANKTEFKALYGNSRITPFKYTFNIIEDDEINAFCLPGGFVYVCRGLLDFVQSDDELAAVMAHEIVHASHHHMIYLLKEQSSIQAKSVWAILIGIIAGGSSGDMSNIMLGSQLYSIAQLNNYGREAERDADYGAIKYLTKTGYNPIGMLTFLERLALKPELVKMGIYSSHPETVERIKNIKDMINELGIPVERWRTTKPANIKVATADENGAQVTHVILNNTVILKPAAFGDASAEQRAYDLANRLEEALKSNLLSYEIKAGSDGVLYIRKQPIMSVTEADAKKMGKTPVQVAEDAASAIRLILWNQIIPTIHG